MRAVWQHQFRSSSRKRFERWRDCLETPCINNHGFLDFGAQDRENPRAWSSSRKWLVTLATSLLSMNATLASSFTSSNTLSISNDFGVSETVAGLSTTVFLLGFAVGSFIFAPLAESFGRRPIHFVTYAAYLGFSVLCALAPNFAALLAGRFFSSVTIAASMSNSPGILADLWEDTDRGNPMAVYSAAAWMGPSIGPVIGGFIEIKHGWQWAMYVLLCINALTTIAMVSIPETCGPVILKKRAKALRAARPAQYSELQSELEANSQSLLAMYKEALIRPWALLFDLINFFCAVYMGVVFTLQFMLLSIYPIVFQTMRGWNEGVGQLPLLGAVAGAIAAALLIVWDTMRRNRKHKTHTTLEPEDRLLVSIIGGVGFPIALFWFAWTANYISIHWMVPTIAGAVLSCAMMLIFVSWTNYIVDSYGCYATSAAAANLSIRSMSSASAPLFTESMFKALGVARGASLIGGVATLLAVIPILLYKHGQKVRAKSKYARGRGGKEEKQDVDQGSPECQPSASVEKDQVVRVHHQEPAKLHA
ncbi:hypothetical protein CDD82_6334 [Ophiocordyceps australis]|uniref:Major facilitator superfamily (MFS) profile domain-containing protein n=1 Tax=Ophiocordyceps australis TaxID=1399860 RepID=A0A2C5YVL5_9HYPO|nr:hypothetical protein CDD82_6334 [Ophiocordyceps australis]